MDFLFQIFMSTFVVTLSFVLLSLASIGKENAANCRQAEVVYQDEEIEDVTYEEIDESVTIESLRENQVRARYREIG